MWIGILYLNGAEFLTRKRRVAPFSSKNVTFLNPNIHLVLARYCHYQTSQLHTDEYKIIQQDNTEKFVVNVWK